MGPERWKELEEIYFAALPLNQGARRAFLDQACAGNENLRREVESLLAAADRVTGDFLQCSIFTLGMQALASEEEWRTKVFSDKAKLDGRYEILGDLGAGGMGKVYKARDTHVTHRLVVVKVLKEEWLNNKYVVTKFKQEADAIAKIDDPGVVGILDAGVLASGQPWLVMQYVEGSELSQPIREAPGGMEFAQVADIIRQVGRALSAAHHAGVIHRDLKPGNIMIRRNNSGDLQVKVIDFGVAKVKDTAFGAAPPTQFQVGTPLYMSPEQINVQDVTSASDVYALGVIAYQMLTGKLPYNPKDRGELPTLQKNGVKVKPSVLRDGLSEAADRAILKALSYEASKRQQSAREFGDELARALTPPLDTTPPIIDKRWLIAAAAVVLAAVITGVIWWALYGRTSPQPHFGKLPEGAAAPVASTPMDHGFSYWVTVQKYRDGKPYQKPFRLAGADLIFESDYRIRLNLSTLPPGYFYVLNEAPKKENNRPRYLILLAKQISESESTSSVIEYPQNGWIEFDENTGEEKLWLIWKREQIEEFENVKKLANPYDGGLLVDQAQIDAVNGFLTRNSAAKTEVEKDGEKNRTNVKWNGNLLTYQMRLEHR